MQSLRIALAALLCLSGAAVLPAQPRVLLVHNETVPEGRAVVEAWRRWRPAVEAAELAITAPKGETVERATYEEAIAGPIRAFLDRPESADVVFVVPVFGVPLRIAEQKGDDGERRKGQERNQASVDSELALVRKPQGKIEGWVESPLHDRATPVRAADGILGVVRLDGPTAEISAGLVEKAVLAELFGTAGPSFLDTRGLSDRSSGYGQRDIHMRTVGASWKRIGFPFDHDDKAAVIDLSGRELLHYQGWYAGSPKAWKGQPRFRTGAIAVHLHSFAAATVRDPRRNWVAPLLAWGATATIGTAWEPYTVGFPYEGIFWNRIARGWSLGEAAVAASQLLSWQAVILGDPLYRPYPEGFRQAQAERRGAFARAVEAWPDAPEPLPFDGFAAAFEGIGVRLRGVVALAEERDAAAAIASFEALLFLCRDHGFEGALGKALAPSLGKLVERELAILRRSLREDPTDRKGLATLESLGRIASLFQLERRRLGVREATRQRQESLVAKALRLPWPRPGSRGLLALWRALARAGACTLAERRTEVLIRRMSLERVPRTAKALRAEAEASLQRGLRAVESLLRRKRFAEAHERLLELDGEHPDCPSKKRLASLLARARKGASE